MDGRTVPQRAVDVLAGLKADVVALQEVIGAGPSDSGHAEEIGAALGMGWVMASVRHLRGHQFGNVVLSHYPIRQHVQYDLSWRTCEPRCCQRADILVDNQTLHLFNVHLGTAYRERKDQADRLAAIVHDGRIHPPKILLGDFNEWSRFSAVSRRLKAHFDVTRRLPTFPARAPVVGLDRVWVHPRGHLRETRVDSSPAARLASDHLPLVATIECS